MKKLWERFGIYAVPAWRVAVLLLLIVLVQGQRDLYDEMPSSYTIASDVGSYVEEGAQEIKRKIRDYCE